MRSFKNIALVGFMGTGKSTVGHLLASMLHLRFLDTDALIEERAGRRIAEIFATDGEAAFRQMESEICADLAQKEGCVISTGGGMVVNPANLASLKEHALVVCLWASAETIYNRVKNQGHRPLLKTADPLARIQELLTQRAPFYRQADVLLNCEQRSPREVAQHVAHQFRLAARTPA